MAWTTLTTPPSWNVTDVELIKRLQYMLLENGAADADGSTLLTNMFSISEIVSYLNERQQKFLRDTACVWTRASEGTTPGVTRYALPTDWILTRRLTWAAVGGMMKSLPRVDAWQLDQGMTDWEQNQADPSVYNDGSDLPTLTVEIAKAPAQVGTMTLGYIGLPPTLNGSVGAPVALGIPDEMESAILYGTLADLLGSDGEMHDPERAAYCEMRYSMAVEMAKALMSGGE